MLIIPLYRAKVLGLDNNYIIGFYQQYIEGFENNIYHEINNTLIDPATISINFNDMQDSQGNKIFASLNENGKGGDILINPNHEKENGLNEFIAVYHNWSIMGLWTDGSGKIGFRLAFNNKVIGIQK